MIRLQKLGSWPVAVNWLTLQQRLLPRHETLNAFVATCELG